MDNRIKYVLAISAAGAFMMSAYLYPAETFITFTVGWLFFIPAAFIVYMVYGFMDYMKERKNRIMISVKPSEAVRALARREAELKNEKEMLFEELRRRG
ncbi:MAG: hypothetical protein PHU34_09080 [Candidatus Methanoperedens sp.]|nr:hypothetical protein [Candidatus Methanoperedens sp.]